MRLAVTVTVFLPVASLLKRRVTREDLCSKRWRLPARSCMTLPVPVRRKVFFAPLWVFIFGIASSFLYSSTSKTIFLNYSAGATSAAGAGAAFAGAAFFIEPFFTNGPSTIVIERPSFFGANSTSATATNSSANFINKR